MYFFFTSPICCLKRSSQQKEERGDYAPPARRPTRSFDTGILLPGLIRYILKGWTVWLLRRAVYLHRCQRSVCPNCLCHIHDVRVS